MYDRECEVLSKTGYLYARPITINGIENNGEIKMKSKWVVIISIVALITIMMPIKNIDASKTVSLDVNMIKIDEISTIGAIVYDGIDAQQLREMMDLNEDGIMSFADFILFYAL